jgi:hypothetical protein
LFPPARVRRRQTDRTFPGLRPVDHVGAPRLPGVGAGPGSHSRTGPPGDWDQRLGPGAAAAKRVLGAIRVSGHRLWRCVCFG